MEPLTPLRAEEILDAAGRVRVLVVGDLMLDQYLVGTVERISPEAPVPVVRIEDESYAVGGAANVAANVVALGAGCGVVGTAGDDAGGAMLLRELAALGVATEGLVTTAARPTTVKTRVLAQRRQQVVRFDREREDDVDDDTARALAARIAEGTRDVDVIVMEDYNKGVLVPAVIAAALAEARARGLPSVVDPKRLRFFEYAGATLFKPNAKELGDSVGVPLRPDEPEWMEDVRHRLGCEALLLTLGEAGMALRTRSGEYLRVPAMARQVYDVSGAGDTVTAVMAVALGAGATLVEAAVLANHAAALEVAKAGVATVGPEEILEQCRNETRA